MAMTLHVDIVSAEAEIFSGTAVRVFVPGTMGELGILPRHAPLLTTLRPGEVRVEMPGGEEQIFYVSSGMLEIQPHVVTILSDTALRAHDLDEAKALESKRAAEEAMKNKTGAMEIAKAQAELAEAVAQLETIKRLRKRSGR
ncbi:MAG: F0F1 ATP synthase subunit epsilon [Gammaproteobacteria bacterium]